MVSVAQTREQLLREIRSDDNVIPRRPATVSALDARLSVWGQAARDAVLKRAETAIDGAVLYVERVGRNASILRSSDIDASQALLDSNYDPLVQLLATVLPDAVIHSCRLLWVDTDRLRERLTALLQPAVEAARMEIRRRQALYRRRARLWHRDQLRLDRLREEIEGVRVPRCAMVAPEIIARGLLIRHREDAGMVESASSSEDSAETGSCLNIRSANLNQWIKQLEFAIGEQMKDEINRSTSH